MHTENYKSADASRKELYKKLSAVLCKLDVATEDLFMDRLDRNPNREEITALCDTHLNMTLVESLEPIHIHIGGLMEMLSTYVQLRFSTRPTNPMDILGFSITVDSLLHPAGRSRFSRAETVEQRIERLDKDLLESLGGKSVTQAKFVETLFSLAAKVNPLFVREQYSGELGAQLGAFVSDKLNTPALSVMTIGGQQFAVNPVAKSATPNIDIMMASHERNLTRDMFRPYLIRSIYSYLVGKAFLGHTTTYEAIANEFGLPNKGNQLGSTLSPLLASIYHFCRNNQQPHLTAIVVRKSGEDKDLPGKGFWDLYNAVDDRNERRLMTKTLQADVFTYWASLGQ